jgi:hypothetical protein
MILYKKTCLFTTYCKHNKMLPIIALSPSLSVVFNTLKIFTFKSLHLRILILLLIFPFVQYNIVKNRRERTISCLKIETWGRP